MVQLDVDLGITGPDKGKGGKYLLLPPGYTGAMSGRLSRRASRNVQRLGRLAQLRRGRRPQAGRRRGEDNHENLSARAGRQPPRLDVRRHVRQTVQHGWPGRLPFWEMLNQVVQEEPTDSIDPTTLGFWASIGIEKGKPFAPDARMKKILTEAAAVGDATARAIAYRMPENEAATYFDDAIGGSPLSAATSSSGSPGVPNLNAAAMFFFAATGVTPAMDTKIVGEGSTYPWTAVDANKNPSGRRQELQAALAAEHPGQGFLVGDRLQQPDPFDGPDGPAVPQREQPEQGFVGERRRLGGRVFRPEASGRQETNWVQTIPGKSWFTILRLYGPLEPWFNKTWRPGEIELVN